MDLFPDGSHVRLRSRVLGTYISADEDGVGVSLSPRRASLNSAWAVHRIMRGGISFILLHGAAYGRYLALRGGRVAQRDRDDFDPDPDALLWRAIRGWNEGDDVLIRHDDVQRNLRANASRLLPWRRRASVTVDRLLARRSKMMRWVVEAIPPRAAPPDLPPLVPVLSPNVGAPHRRGLFRQRARAPVDPERTIWYLLADEDGNVNELNWEYFSFSGQSVFDLRARVACLVGVEDATQLTLCVRGGNQGRRTPLVVDLPSGTNATMIVIALTTGSPGAAALVYPDVDAEAP
ncbi:unnamed protein product [Urochloa humidicola]